MCVAQSGHHLFIGRGIEAVSVVAHGESLLAAPCHLPAFGHVAILPMPRAFAEGLFGVVERPARLHFHHVLGECLVLGIAQAVAQLRLVHLSISGFFHAVQHVGNDIGIRRKRPLEGDVAVVHHRAVGGIGRGAHLVHERGGVEADVGLLGVCGQCQQCQRKAKDLFHGVRFEIFVCCKGSLRRRDGLSSPFKQSAMRAKAVSIWCKGVLMLCKAPL